MILSAGIDPPADFRGPQLDAVVLEQRRHRRVLATVERPLILPPITIASHPRSGSASGLLPLPRQRGDRILMILGRHPP
jgi:hypothetical protein